MVRLLTWLAPARTVPVVSWRAPSRWRPDPATLVVLVVGLALFGLGEAFVVQAGLGVSPWTVLAQGLSVRTGWEIGWTTLVVGVGVLLLWLPLRERPGPGTLLNVVVISATLGFGVQILPAPEQLFIQVPMVFAGIGLVGLGSGLYLTCRCGPGPRDGWMTGVHERTGWPVSWVRLRIEVAVLSVGWLLGGTVGFGTLAFALFIGPAVGLGLRLAGWVGGVPGSPDTEDDEFPELDA